MTRYESKAKERKEKKRGKEGRRGRGKRERNRKKISTTKCPPIEDWLGKLKLCPYNVISYSK